VKKHCAVASVSAWIVRRLDPQDYKELGCYTVCQISEKILRAPNINRWWSARVDLLRTVCVVVENAMGTEHATPNKRICRE